MSEFSQLDNDITEAYQKKQMDKVCSLYFEAANYFENKADIEACLLYTSPSPRDGLLSRMPSSA